MTSTGGSVTSYGEEEDGEEEEDGGEGGSKSEGSFGVCPICGKRFRKKNGNQMYDSDECRRIARQQKRGGFR